MSIPAPGQSLAPGQSTFSDDMLKIELGGPSRQHLSVIDVPGIFRTPTYGVTTKEDMTLVRRMVKSYIKDSRTIILAVIPAPVDIATQEILSMAEEADQLGQRTLGVLTKPDLVDKGGEELVMDLVHGTKNKLNLGYCMVRNRGQQEKALSSTDRRQNERHFFSTSPWSALDKSRVGIPALQDRLRELLVDITRREFPNVKYEIDRRLSDCERPAQDRKRILTQRYRSGGEANGLKVSCRTPKLEERTPQESQIKYKKGQPNELSVRDFPFENDRGCKRAGETAGEKAGPIKQGEEGRRGNMQEIV